MTFPKTKDYVATLYDVSQMLIEKSRSSNDQKLKGIARLVYMYFLNSCNELNLKSNDFSAGDNRINVSSLMEYIANNNIELYDLKNMNMAEMDPHNPAHIESYTLSHILYIVKNN